MTNKEALDVLWKAAEIAQKSGGLSIQDAVIVHLAYRVLEKQISENGESLESS